MASKLFGSLVRRIGIDLGTQNIRIWTDKDGLVVEEACILAVDKSNKKVLAIGNDALEMVGRVGPNVQLVYPIVDGRITDLRASELLIKNFIQQVVRKKSLLYNPLMMIGVNAGSTPADQLVASRLLYNLGAKEAYTILQPLASSIGAGVPIADASGCFLLQMGRGVVEAVVVSLGSVVSKQSSNYAGQYLERRLQHVLKKTYGMAISGTMVLELLTKLVTLQAHDRTLALTGKDTKTDRPKEVLVSSQAILPELQQVIGKYEQLIKKLLSSVPPELTVDVIDKGLLLAGGLAQLEGLPEYFTSQIGVPVSVVDTPEQTVIQGIGTALEHLELFKQSLAYQYAPTWGAVDGIWLI